MIRSKHSNLCSGSQKSHVTFYVIRLINKFCYFKLFKQITLKDRISGSYRSITFLLKTIKLMIKDLIFFFTLQNNREIDKTICESSKNKMGDVIHRKHIYKTVTFSFFHGNYIKCFDVIRGPGLDVSVVNTKVSPPTKFRIRIRELE